MKQRKSYQPKQFVEYACVEQQGTSKGKYKIVKITGVEGAYDKGGEPLVTTTTLYKNLGKGDAEDLHFRLINNLSTSKK